MAESVILFRRRALSGTISSRRLPSHRSISCSSRLSSGSLLKHKQPTSADSQTTDTVRSAVLYLSLLSAIFQVYLTQPVPDCLHSVFYQFCILSELMVMEVVVTTGAMRCTKLQSKSSPPTNQHPLFYRPDALPVAQSTVSEHLKGNIMCTSESKNSKNRSRVR